MTKEIKKQIAFHSQQITKLLNEQPISKRETKAVRQAKMQNLIDRKIAGK